jgi:large subunit ribosomal protein L24
MSKLNVKKGDNVMVIAGKDKGKAGKVLKVDTDGGRVFVEGVNMVSKSKKPRNAQQKGGILKQEGTIDISNVMHICSECDKIVRVAHKEETVDGKVKKIRVCAKCGASLDEKKVSSKRAAKAVKKTAAKKKEKAEKGDAKNAE